MTTLTHTPEPDTRFVEEARTKLKKFDAYIELCEKFSQTQELPTPEEYIEIKIKHDIATVQEENMLFDYRVSQGLCVACGEYESIKKNYCQNCLDESEANMLV